MYSQYGYQPTGSVARLLGSNHDGAMEQGQNLAFNYGRQYDQQEHEKGLQASEQQRRQYDSETARMLGSQRNQFLGNLINSYR